MVRVLNQHAVKAANHSKPASAEPLLPLQRVVQAAWTATTVAAGSERQHELMGMCRTTRVLTQTFDGEYSLANRTRGMLERGHTMQQQAQSCLERLNATGYVHTMT
jgi:hypothetical protein